MKKLAIAGIAAAAFCGASAFAADMPVKAPPSASAAFDWSGFYIGGAAGWQGSRIRLDDPIVTDLGPLVFTPHHDSFALGGHLGAQRQFGQFVLGIEGDYVAGFGHQSLGATNSISIFVPGGTGTAQAKMRDIWSIGGRAGWAAGNWMPYITGGYASGSFELDAHNTPPTVPNSLQARATTGGAYLGGGIDWLLANNWIFGVEYRHYDFQKKLISPLSTTGGPINTRFDPRTDTVMARLTYKFGGDPWGKSPVVAKY